MGRSCGHLCVWQGLGGGVQMVDLSGLSLWLFCVVCEGNPGSVCIPF